MKERNLQLDLLRCVAIMGVLIEHTINFRSTRWWWDRALIIGGWTGVDLFFVLSGFLISGLLFSEFQKRGRINFARFAVRRALKLYPTLYVLVFGTMLWRLIHAGFHNVVWIIKPALHDIFFVQSYRPGTYGHFWSLSVEEHFYILLPLTLYFMLRRSRPNEDDPFRLLPWLFSIVALTEIAVRLLTTLWIPFTIMTHVEATHLRLDSLLFGVLLSYWSIFHSERFWTSISRKYPLILGVGVLLLLPLLIMSPDRPWTYTYGFTLNYLGFGAIMVGLLAFPLGSLPKAAQGFFRSIAYIGGFSYSIYLWHIPWMLVLGKYEVLPIRYMGLLVYLVGAIVLGIVTSKLVEIPVLRLRERLFPAR